MRCRYYVAGFTAEIGLKFLYFTGSKLSKLLMFAIVLLFNIYVDMLCPVNWSTLDITQNILSYSMLALLTADCQKNKPMPNCQNLSLFVILLSERVKAYFVYKIVFT